jgi:hypothetical protein
MAVDRDANRTVTGDLKRGRNQQVAFRQSSTAGLQHTAFPHREECWPKKKKKEEEMRVNTSSNDGRSSSYFQEQGWYVFSTLFDDAVTM